MEDNKEKKKSKTAEKPEAGKEKKQESHQITVNAQYIKDLSFENPKAPASLTAGQQKDSPKIDVNIDVKGAKIGENVYESALTITAKALRKDETVFVVEVTYAGVFTITGLPKEDIEPALLVFCPSLLFPFTRRIIADATRDGGFPPLMLDPIDFGQLYARRKAAQKEEKKAMN